MRLLIVDDETKLLKALEQVFREHHYMADTADNGLDGLDKALSGSYDLLIIDVMLPKLSGYELVRSVRKEGYSTPILLLTAKDAVDDRVEGLDSGADDYLVKPFATKELLARVRALTRRSGDVMGTKTLEVGGFTLNLMTRSVTVYGDELALTAKEFQMLELFLRHPGQVMPKELILDRIWGFEAPVDTNAVEIYVHFLRKKIESHREKLTEGNTLPAIETVRGVGYALRGLADV